MIQRTLRCLLGSTLAIALTAALTAAPSNKLTVRHDADAGKITIHRDGIKKPLVTQHARADHRPYLHPILSPDGKGELTQYSPGHHKHQTGLYWGLTRVNGRDYFHNPGGDYWRLQKAEVLEAAGEKVKWRTTYEQLDEQGGVTLIETQNWEMHIDNTGRALLDLQWKGDAKTDVTVSKYDYGGLFLRMPWKKGLHAHVMDAANHSGHMANKKRSMWLDLGMPIEGLEEEGHIAIFDHPKNEGFPNAWRVDGQYGVGPSRAIQGDWKILKDKSKTFRHRFVVYTGDLNNKIITEDWTAWSGQKYTSALWNLAKDEGHRAKFLAPDEAVAAMTIEDEFTVNAWASEPMITQPMAFCWDDRGRMWVAENRDYESRGHGFSNFGDSRILIIEDTDRDGVADSRKVFAEGIPFPAGIAVGLGGLWLGAPPNLLFVPDKDGDDKADMDDIEVRLTGWGIRDRHETLNSFHWGPDGWLYGLQGFATTSKVGKPKDGGRLLKHKEGFPKNIELDGPGTDINGGVWRYHPTKDRFEVVAHGFSNPWGIDYDAKGNLFITACVIPHLWHVIPGGIYHRQGGSHYNPHFYSDIRTIADHRHRSAHGGARIYNSDAYPERYQGQIFMANIHEHAVLVDKLEPAGSGFIGRHGETFMAANNAQWIGFSMEIGPAGDVFVLDWHDADICGNSVKNKETGRIFRMAPKQSLAKDFEHRYDDLGQLPDQKLIGLQTSRSAWHARRARVILQGRASAGKLDGATHGGLRKLLNSNRDIDFRLRALWALHVTGGADEQRLTELLQSPEEHLRAWAIQLLCEDKAPPAGVLSTFASMAAKDPSPVVRLYLTSALQRLPMEARWPIAAALCRHQADVDDHNLPKMLWFAIEPMAAADPKRALEMISVAKIPILQKYVARRAASADKIDAVIDAIIATSDNNLRRELLNGTLDGIGGRKKIPAPDNWARAYPQLEKDKGVADKARQLAQRFGDSKATKAFLKIVSNKKAPIKKRQAAVATLAAEQHAELAPKLIALLDESPMRLAAIRAMAAYEVDAMADTLIKRYPKLSAAEREAAILTLSSRPKYGWKLAQALKPAIPRDDIPPYVARQLRRVVGSGFVEIWGPVEDLREDLDASMKKYRALLTEEAIAAADPKHGRTIFNNTCASCHKMYGKGGDLGPDITGSNRADLNYILPNIIHPNDDIPEGYQMTIVSMRDGRIHTGLVSAETDRQLTLRQIGNPKPIQLEKSEIQNRESPKISLMPAGLLNSLEDEDAVALIRYLRTTEEVE